MPPSGPVDDADITRLRQQVRALAAANDALKKEIAERQSSEAALRESERSLRSVVDGIPGLVAWQWVEGGHFWRRHEPRRRLAEAESSGQTKFGSNP